MSPMIFLIFASAMMAGTGIVLTSSHWFFVWLGLEINTLAFLPLLLSTHQPRATEAAMKYFLMQALASTLLLFGGLIQAALFNSWSVSIKLFPITLILLISAMALKMAMVPFHFWLMDVLQGLPFRMGLMLSTWQKMAPFSILLMLPKEPMWMFFGLGVLSALIGSFGGLNQTQVRKLLAYSSVAHMGWMFTAYPLSSEMSTLTLFIYFIMMSTMFMAFHLLNTLNLADMSNIIHMAPWLTAITLLLMLSLGGLPPFTGFTLKWLIMLMLISKAFFMTTMVLVMASLMSLFFYLRMNYLMILTLSPQYSILMLMWRSAQRTPMMIWMLMPLMMLSLFGILMAPVWMSLFF